LLIVEKIRIGIFASENTTRSISILFRAHPEIELSMSTASPHDLLHFMTLEHLPVVLLEATPALPDIPGFLNQLQVQHSKSQYLILAHELDLTNVRQVVDAGAMGYLLIQPNFEGLVAAIPLVRAGKFTLSPQIMHLLVSLI
jgi:DNA-binding NarL/FixJ family response regulator